MADGTEDELARLRQELADARRRLVQAEKMASLGMLVAGIAHEINTPIGAVRSMHGTLTLGVDKLRRLLDAEIEGGVDGHPKITKVFGIIDDANRVIGDGTGRVTNIVKRLKSFARLDETELEPTDLNEGIETTLTLIHHELKHGVTVHRELATLPSVHCVPGRLNQVFLNLLMNAKQAMPKGGDITVRTWSDADAVHVAIEDTGVGMSQEVLQHVFETGFTTKAEGVGTGLGLSICMQIVEEHFGELTVTSEVGKGSTFTVSVPLDVETRHAERRNASETARPAE